MCPVGTSVSAAPAHSRTDTSGFQRQLRQSARPSRSPSIGEQLRCPYRIANGVHGSGGNPGLLVRRDHPVCGFRNLNQPIWRNDNGGRSPDVCHKPSQHRPRKRTLPIIALPNRTPASTRNYTNDPPSSFQTNKILICRNRLEHPTIRVDNKSNPCCWIPRLNVAHTSHFPPSTPEK